MSGHSRSKSLKTRCVSHPLAISSAARSAVHTRVMAAAARGGERLDEHGALVGGGAGGGTACSQQVGIHREVGLVAPRRRAQRARRSGAARCARSPSSRQGAARARPSAAPATRRCAARLERGGGGAHGREPRSACTAASPTCDDRLTLQSVESTGTVAPCLLLRPAPPRRTRPPPAGRAAAEGVAESGDGRSVMDARFGAEERTSRLEAAALSSAMSGTPARAARAAERGPPARHLDSDAAPSRYHFRKRRRRPASTARRHAPTRQVAARTISRKAYRGVGAHRAAKSVSIRAAAHVRARSCRRRLGR